MARNAARRKSWITGGPATRFSDVYKPAQNAPRLPDDATTEERQERELFLKLERRRRARTTTMATRLPKLEEAFALMLKGTDPEYYEYDESERRKILETVEHNLEKLRDGLGRGHR